MLRAVLATVVAGLALTPGLTVSAGGPSYGLAFAGGSVWVGGLGSGQVLRVDPGTGRIERRIAVGPRIFNLAPAPGAVWALSNALSTATRIDARTGKVTATVQVGSGPYDAAWGFGSLWVSNSLDGTVSRITGAKVARTIRVGAEPNGLAAIGRWLWVTDHTGGALLRIDPHTNEVDGRVALPGADWVTAAGGSLWVSQEVNQVARVDPVTLKVNAQVRVQRNPLGSAVVHGQLWVPCIDSGSVVVVDPQSAKVVRTFRAGRSPIVVLPAAGHVWISHTAGTSVWRL